MLRCCSVIGLCALAVVAPATTSGAKGLNELVLHSFQGSGGYQPVANLIADGAGNLYGTTQYGGTNDLGTVFKVTPDGAFFSLHSFSGGDGNQPYGGLLLDNVGNFYGTTYEGGENGLGNVFKLAPDGTVTVLHSFDSDGGRGKDGTHPTAGLIADKRGNLLGTTYGGGNGGGTVFKVAPSGKETVLYAFGGTDGGDPYAGLIADKNVLYGTTSDNLENTAGTVFSIAPNGIETVLHRFNNTDGANPLGGLIADKKGNLFGTTFGGSRGNGTVFKLAPDGTLTVLHTFVGATDGQESAGGLIADEKGNLYGTAKYGGTGFGDYCANGCGLVFKVAPNGKFTILHDFTGFPDDGALPSAGLIADYAGNLFGTTSGGGSKNAGTVFEIEGAGAIPPTTKK